MLTPGEHETVQTCILEYVEAIGWTPLSSKEAEQRGRFNSDASPKDRVKNLSLFFDDLLDAKVRKFNPCYEEANDTLLGQFHHLHTNLNDIPVLVIEHKNADKDETIALGVSGSLIPTNEPCLTN